MIPLTTAEMINCELKTQTNVSRNTSQTDGGRDKFAVTLIPSTSCEDVNKLKNRTPIRLKIEFT